MNSKSEFHQHPVVRVVPMRGLQQEQGEDQGGRAQGQRQRRQGQGQWKHIFVSSVSFTFTFRLLIGMCLPVCDSVLAWQRTERDPKLLPPTNTFYQYISVRPVQSGQGNTQQSPLFNLVREPSCPTPGWKPTKAWRHQLITQFSGVSDKSRDCESARLPFIIYWRPDFFKIAADWNL